MSELTIKRDTNDLSVEIIGISMIVTGLANQIDEDCDHLTNKALQSALNGVSQYLERIAEDLGYL